MERWRKAASVEAEQVDEKKASDRVAAVKAEMAKAWDATANRDDMLTHIECWLAGAKLKDANGELHDHGVAPAAVRGCVPREVLHVLLEEVYQEKHPEDFEVRAAEVEPSGEGPYRTPGEGRQK